MEHKYKLLTNQLYLFLLQYRPNGGLINRSLVGRDVGINRKTVAKELQELQELELLDKDNVPKNIFGIKKFYPGEGNKWERAMMILADIDENTYTVAEIADLLGASSRTITKYIGAYKCKGYCIRDLRTNQKVYIDADYDGAVELIQDIIESVDYEE